MIREEAAFLRAKFGASTRRGRARCRSFLPRLVAGRPARVRFDWARVRANREWRTAAALPLLAAVLFALPHVRRAFGV